MFFFPQIGKDFAPLLEKLNLSLLIYVFSTFHFKPSDTRKNLVYFRLVF